MRLLAHDYETTGVDPRTCGVVQSALQIVDLHPDGHYTVLDQRIELHHPGMPIPPPASRVHGITDQDVFRLLHFEEGLPVTLAHLLETYRPVGVLGYNSNRYDNLIARRLGLPEGLIEIDLMVAANRLMSRGLLPRARLVDAYRGLTGREPENAHDALADVTMTLALIPPVMAHLGFAHVQELVDWLGRPEVNVQMRMPFGKHKGQPLNTLPPSYLRWLADKADLKGELALSVQAALNG